MKKIKLVVSDFHLGNGRYRKNGSVNPLEDFHCDRHFIEFLNHYGETDPQKDVEVIINGDFFNMIQLLPEEYENGILTEKAAQEKIEAILLGHEKLFQALKQFNAQPHRRIVFISGNHDPQLIWKGVQEIIKRTIQGEVVFVDDVYRFEKVHIEHGHQLEPIFKMRKDKYFLTKGHDEPILNLPWGVFFVKDFLYKIKRKRPYVDKVSPFGFFMRWCLYNDLFFALFTLVSYVSFIIKTRFSKLPLVRAQAFKGFHSIFFLSQSATLADEAAKIMKNEKCRILILGHTHIPINVSFEDGEYLNPGTWNDVTHLDIPNLGRTRRLIYVLLEYSQDRYHARLLEWFGHQQPFEEIRG
jgi:UDP-2,3-diacylglucosamine pyrophosphatase LpxH